MILEKEREEKENKSNLKHANQVQKTCKEIIVQAMYQVSFKDEEIKGLKVQNHKLSEEINKKVEKEFCLE